MSLIRIKQANFYNEVDYRFSTFVNTVTGYGNAFGYLHNGDLVTGEIYNPTGLQPAVYYKTGLLSGEISGGSGYFNWSDLTLSGSGEVGKVYLNYITGYTQATNILEFLNSTGSGLQNFDVINIANNSFVFKDSPANPSEFNSPQYLINILNSGATGAFNDQGYSWLQTSVGITGYRNSNKLFLFSYYYTGEDGNNIKIYRDTANLNAVKMSGRYFTGGQSFRPLINTWTGDFTNTFNLYIENSGIYTINTPSTGVFGTGLDVVWEDNFSGNYKIYTGLFSQVVTGYIGTQQLNFNTGSNKFYGSGVIPSGQGFAYTGLNIEILKPNPYNISGNLAKYIVSGADFVYSGTIEG